MQSDPKYSSEESSRLSLDSRFDYADMNTNNSQNHQYMDEAAAASISAAQYVPYTSPHSGSNHTDKGTSNNEKVKRAKSMQKITRNRKITSCLQCRERKQKVRIKVMRSKEKKNKTMI